jgi:hypothetical protein
MNIKVGDTITCTTPIDGGATLYWFPKVAEVTESYILDSRGFKWTHDGRRINTTPSHWQPHDALNLDLTSASVTGDTSSRWMAYEPEHEAMAAAEVSKMKEERKP